MIEQSGEIIEQPASSEVYETLPEPEDNNTVSTDEVRKWRSRIDAAREVRDIKLKSLEAWIRIYEGFHWAIEEGEEVALDLSTVNLIFANIKKELPNLYFQNPEPVVSARMKEYELPAFALQELMKFYINYNMGTELKKHVRLAILDAKFIFGTLKTTYTPRFSVNPNKGKPIVLGYTPDKRPVFKITEDGVQMEPNQILTSELYYVERVSPTEMLFDVSCRNFVERSEWLAQEIVKPVSYFKNNALYENTENLQSNVDIRDIYKNKDDKEISAARKLSDKDDTELCRVVEIHDLKNNKLYVLPDNSNNFIREEGALMNPYSFLKFNEKPDSWWPVSDIKQEIPLQQEINIGRSMMMAHARRSARKYFYDEETFNGISPVEGIEAMKDPSDMTLVKVNDLEHRPRVAELAVQDPSIFQNLMQSHNDFNLVSGGTEAGTGFTQRRKTKGEAQFQEGHGAVRMVDKQNLVADFVSETYRNLGELIQATLTKTQAIKIIGPTGIFWTEVKSGDIEGEVFYEIDSAELRPRTPDSDKAALGEFIGIVVNFLGAMSQNPLLQQVFDLQGTIKEIAKSFPNVNAQNILNGQITPEQIATLALKQMENQNANI